MHRRRLYAGDSWAYRPIGIGPGPTGRPDRREGRGPMPRFRVRDLMISVGQNGGDGGPCLLITACGGVTELCVENTMGCAFTNNCNCTLASVCDMTCHCTACTPCTQRTCICSGCTGRSVCNVRSLCGATAVCTPTFAQVGGRDLQPEDLAALK